MRNLDAALRYLECPSKVHLNAEREKTFYSLPSRLQSAVSFIFGHKYLSSQLCPWSSHRRSKFLEESHIVSKFRVPEDSKNISRPKVIVIPRARP